MKEIRITDRKGNNYKILVSDCDYQYVSQFSWSIKKAHSTIYAKTRINHNKWGVMHRMIMKAKHGEQIDHRNHNGLDNRRRNLRSCCNTKNHMNGQMHRDNQSGYKGVSFDKRRGTYRARLKHNGREVWLGSFTTATDAAIAYNKSAKKYFGEFAKLNQI
jgi:hypothetical protein